MAKIPWLRAVLMHDATRSALTQSLAGVVIYGHYTKPKGCVQALCNVSCPRTALSRGILAIYTTPPLALLLKYSVTVT